MRGELRRQSTPAAYDSRSGSGANPDPWWRNMDAGQIVVNGANIECPMGKPGKADAHRPACPS